MGDVAGDDGREALDGQADHGPGPSPAADDLRYTSTPHLMSGAGGEKAGAGPAGRGSSQGNYASPQVPYQAPSLGAESDPSQGRGMPFNMGSMSGTLPNYQSPQMAQTSGQRHLPPQRFATGVSAPGLLYQVSQFASQVAPGYPDNPAYHPQYPTQQYPGVYAQNPALNAGVQGYPQLVQPHQARNVQAAYPPSSWIPQQPAQQPYYVYPASYGQQGQSPQPYHNQQNLYPTQYTQKSSFPLGQSPTRRQERESVPTANPMYGASGRLAPGTTISPIYGQGAGLLRPDGMPGKIILLIVVVAYELKTDKAILAARMQDPVLLAQHYLVVLQGNQSSPDTPCGWEICLQERTLWT
ncbi:MAG: hypothetical protein M1819_002283 [Sarea resinae]|nr:MAG: hypothetical protein M1819_002283 [Sarea resinae]